MATMNDERRLAELHQRLDNGWEVIDAEPDPKRREELTDFWLRLLETYTRLADLVRR